MDDYDEGETQGHCMPGPSFTVEELRPRVKKGKGYVQKYLAEEEDALSWTLKSDEHSCELDEVESTSVSIASNVSDLEKEKVHGILKDYYNGRPKPRLNLVIDDFKDQILSAVEANDVVVLTGPTGCGKSTQVPQYLLDSSITNHKYCNIVATQPRKIAAISISRRICESREWELGKLCGFKVGLKDRTSADTLLTFMTTGVLLQTLINRKSLNQFTHIILDEIHERDQSMDFLLIVIKKLLNQSPTNTKVILMSATVEAQTFARYFPRKYQEEIIPCPVVTIDRPTNHKVDIYYLDDLSVFGEVPVVDAGNTHISELAYDICIKLLKNFENIECGHVSKNAVLIFLPGIHEIETLYYKLNNSNVQSHGEPECKWSLLPLHSSITLEEQAEVFLPSKPGCRKIILSTNIAESSITVPGVKYVIDFCLTKRMKNDPTTNFNGLQLCWASQANCIQRAGRVGRLMDGKVYRMVQKKFFEELDRESMPEMLDAPLDKVILQTKMLDMGEPRALLALALDPPDLSDIEWTILTLKEAGGLLRRRLGAYKRYDGDLTFLGRLMAILPVDIRITKLIAMGHIFGCLSDCIIMGAAMSLKNVFNYPFRDRLKAYELKCNWAENSFSDCIALLNVYKIWSQYRTNGYFERSMEDDEFHWARRNFLHIRALKDMDLLVEEIKLRLKEYSIEDFDVNVKKFNNDVEKMLLLKVAIAGAFYPHYFCPGFRFGNTCEQEAVKELGGQNPFTTVMLHGFPSDQPAELYFAMIKECLSDWNAQMKLHAHSCSKILVEFRHWQPRMRLHGERNLDEMAPGKIPMEVYRALKTRRIKKSIHFKVLPPYEAKKRAEHLGITCWNYILDEYKAQTENFLSCPLPAVDVSFINIIISHIVDPGHFWALYAHTLPNQDKILNIIEKHLSKCKPFEQVPAPGKMCIAPLSDTKDTRFYRARIESVRKNPSPSAQVFFVDHGGYREVDVKELREYGPDLMAELKAYPGLVFECVLCRLRPSSTMNVGGLWTKASLAAFKKVIQGGRLFGHVYSVVRGVVSMELHNLDYKNNDTNINEFLINEKYAEKADEPHFSRMNHSMRTESLLSDYQKSACSQLQEGQCWPNADQTKFNEEELTVNVQLKGPSSPLEMTLYPSLRGTLSKSVAISEDSVNSVLLDTEPRDRHDRLVVAGSVTQNADGSKLVINHTTVMPNIHGLAALIPLMFAPEIEFRVNRDRTKYTAMLCGLGVDDKGRPLFPEHDMEVYFDCEITFEDYLEVNRLRRFMSLLLRVDKYEPYLTRAKVVEYQEQIRATVLKLLNKDRRATEIDLGRGAHRWRRTTPDIFPSSKRARALNEMCTFPHHPGTSLAKRFL